MFHRMDLPPTAERIARMANLSALRSGLPAMKREKKRITEKKKGFFFILEREKEEREATTFESGVAVGVEKEQFIPHFLSLERFGLWGNSIEKVQ